MPSWISFTDREKVEVRLSRLLLMYFKMLRVAASAVIACKQLKRHSAQQYLMCESATAVPQCVGREPLLFNCK